MKLYEAIAQNFLILNNPDSKFLEIAIQRQERIKKLLPKGSGFDKGTEVQFCTAEKIILSTSFHHMDENGYYDGWSEHEIIVKASLLFGFTLRVTGRNKRGIKEYIADTFHYLLSQDFDFYNAKDSEGKL